MQRLSFDNQPPLSTTPLAAPDTLAGRVGHVLNRWQRTVTLHLEESELRLLVVRQGRPEQWDAIAIPGGIFEDGEVSDPESLAGLVNTLFERSEVRRRNVRVTVGGFHAVMRTLTMPKLKPRFMPEAISRQLRREVPVALEDHHLSWSVIRSSGETVEEVEVLVVAIPRNELEGVLRALRLVGIQPASVEWKPIAVLRSLNVPRATVVVLEESSFDIILSRNGRPVVTRNIAYPPSARAMSQRVDVASTELGLAISYVALEQGDETAPQSAPVFLLGENAATEGVREQFEESSGYPLEEPWFLAEGQSLWGYAANLGAAAPRSSSVGAPFLNVTPEQWRPTTVNAPEGVAAMGLAVGLGIVALPFFHSLQPDPKIAQLQQQVDQARIELRVEQDRAAKSAQLTRKVNDVQSTLAAYQKGLSTLQDQKLRWLDVVNATPAGLRNVVIHSVSEDGKSLSLSGSASSYSEIADYAQFLYQTGWFDDIQLSSLTPSRDNGAGASFDFHFSAKRVQTGGG